MAKADIAKNQSAKLWARKKFEEFALALVDEEHCSVINLEIVVL